jgi:hypothetical protein
LDFELSKNDREIEFLENLGVLASSCASIEFALGSSANLWIE